MLSRSTKPTIVGWVVFLSWAAASTPQTRLKGRVHTPGDDPLVAREHVSIEGAGQYTTDDHGEFEFDLGGDLKVGGEARFHVYHVNPAIGIQQWIVIRPCDNENGRTLSLPAVGARPISIVVLPKGDQRLKSLNKDYSILECIVEESASEFKPTASSGGRKRSALFDRGSSVVARQVPYRPFSGIPITRGFPRFVELSYRVHAQEKSSVSSLPHVRSSTLLDERLLARKAEELGFTRQELAEAINAWARSVEDSYEKGLAALYEGRYTEASEYISASIPSPPGEFLNRYAPLARAEYEMGHYSAAEAALRKILAVHSDDPLILNNLGVVLDAEAKYAEAEPLLKRALTINESALGPDHSTVAISLNNLALLYFEQGKYAEAETLFKRALAIDENALGPHHPGLATDLNNLAVLYEAQSRYADAEALYKRALTMDEEALGPEHLKVATDLNNLGELYRTQGRYTEAEPFLKRALAIDETALGSDHPAVATPLNNLTLLYDSQGKYSEAEPLIRRALAINEKALGPDHPTIATNLNSLATLYKSQGRYAEAEPLLKRALAIDEKALGPDHPDVAIYLNNLAKLSYFEGKYSEAELLYKRALTIKEKAFGLDDPEGAWSLNNLGLLYHAQGRLNEAEPLFKRALAIDEKALGADNPTVAEIAKNLAANLRDLGREAEAKTYEDQAARIRAKNNK